MPALTVRAISKALSGYVRPDEDIVAKLNLVMPRVYAMGMWRDLLFDWQISTTNDYFSLPEHAESMLGCMLQDTPVDMQARWHDYRISGYASDGPSPIYGVIDDGWHPTKEDLVTAEDTDVYEIEIRPISPNTNLPEDGSVTVTVTLDSDATALEEYTFTGQAGTATSSNATIVGVSSIAFEDVAAAVEVVAVNQETDDEYTLAVLRGDGVARYRRFRFQNSTSATRDVKLLLKRAWQPVLVDTDIVHLGNLNAIKHGLLGMIAEDNADLERAQYHWTICRQLLDEELDAARGAVKPKLNLNPAGVGTYIPNIL